MSFGSIVSDGAGRPRILNWKASPRDPRDLLFTRADFLRAARDRTTIPSKVDLRSGCSEIEDQGSLGSCTGQAVVGGGCEFLQRRAGNGVQLSRLFAYYNGRRMMGPWYIPQDSGCTIRTMIKAVARYGVCEESLWPYDEKRFASRPTVAAFADASRWQLTEYALLESKVSPESTLSNIRRTLASGFTVSFGFDVYDSFMSAETARTGLAPVPDKKKERFNGGHAVQAVGYDDACGQLIVRNSWGKAWGLGGYFMLPYAFVLGGLASDFWAVTGQENGSKSGGPGWIGWLRGFQGYLVSHKEGVGK